MYGCEISSLALRGHKTEGIWAEIIGDFSKLHYEDLHITFTLHPIYW
jgi:hypothetical protein